MLLGNEQNVRECSKPTNVLEGLALQVNIAFITARFVKGFLAFFQPSDDTLHCAAVLASDCFH
jgi:hypothetical protein